MWANDANANAVHGVAALRFYGNDGTGWDADGGAGEATTSDPFKIKARQTGEESFKRCRRLPPSDWPEDRRGSRLRGRSRFWQARRAKSKTIKACLD